MKSEYITYLNPTKEILDTIQVGDLIKCNDWKRPLRVQIVSENFFIMTRNLFGQCCYSICSKNPSDFSRNYIREGFPVIGMDNYVFGKFDYFNPDDLKEAIEELETGKMEVSVRSSCALLSISIKHEGGKRILWNIKS